MARSLRRKIVLVVVLLLWAGAAVAEEGRAPRVVASILPVHSLAAGVMAGVGAPVLLLPAAASPHTYSLRPSEAARLAEADVVFWIGPGLESFLAKPLATLAASARVVALAEVEGVARLSLGEEQEAPHEEEDHAHGAHDPHVWLDPDNARAMTRAIAATLAEADPLHAARYRANAERLDARIEALDDEIALRLAPLRGTGFVVFHDAYRHLVRQYGLAQRGVITIDPERGVGARRLADLRARIEAGEVACVFGEPQFRPDLVATLIEGTSARAGTLDPLGRGLTPSPDAYFQLMRGLANALADCLSG
jgi:zinc transport system substrate-binding protein